MARWHHCNVLQADAASRRLWQFDAVRDGFKLDREHTILVGKPLPQGAVVKSWDSLWRKKLNVALLPSEQVFLRVLQLPTADETEAQQIVELQLERLSPLPITQIVWSLHLLPKTGESTTRTAIVLIADRSVVEKHLGRFESEGYLADRLELPALDQVLATEADEDDGAWVFPGEAGAPALIAWWADGILRSLAWLNLPDGDQRAKVLREQLLQMAWAGELEGWLQEPPRLHLVADELTAAAWQPLFDTWTEWPVAVEAPLPPAELIARTARRSAGAKSSLMPAEFAKRYHQQFVDRLWMRGLGAIVMLYIFGVLIYFGALTYMQYKLDAAEANLLQTGTTFTNVLQLKARSEVLRDRADLKFAALDCWKALAEELPEGAIVQQLNLAGGKTFTVNGTVPASEAGRILDLYESLRRLTPNGRQLFSRIAGEAPVFNPVGVDATMSSWRFSVELERAEEK